MAGEDDTEGLAYRLSLADAFIMWSLVEMALDAAIRSELQPAGSKKTVAIVADLWADAKIQMFLRLSYEMGAARKRKARKIVEALKKSNRHRNRIAHCAYVFDKGKLIGHRAFTHAAYVGKEESIQKETIDRYVAEFHDLLSKFIEFYDLPKDDEQPSPSRRD